MLRKVDKLNASFIGNITKWQSTLIAMNSSSVSDRRGDIM